MFRHIWLINKIRPSLSVLTRNVNLKKKINHIHCLQSDGRQGFQNNLSRKFIQYIWSLKKLSTCVFLSLSLFFFDNHFVFILPELPAQTFFFFFCWGWGVLICNYSCVSTCISICGSSKLRHWVRHCHVIIPINLSNSL